MKQLMFTCILLLYAAHARSQLIQNGYFSINSGNNNGSCGQNNILNTFSDFSVPNWFVTHGSPSFCLNLANCPHPHDISMVSGQSAKGGLNPVSEGIIGGYKFTAGKTYNIRVGVRQIDNPLPVRMVAVKGARPFNGSCTNMCFDGGLMNGNIPVPFPANSSTMQEVTVPSLVFGPNDFTFTPNNDFDWIMIFPFNLACDQRNIDVAYLFINKQCEDDVCIWNVDNSQPSEKIYAGYRRLTAGSGCGPNYATPTSATNIITFQATNSILLRDVFEAVPGYGQSFTAYITPYACDAVPTGDIYLPKYNSNGGQNGEFVKSRQYSVPAIHSPGDQQLAQGMKIYPNPTTGNFSVDVYTLGEYELKILNGLGAVVYEAHIQGGKKHMIQLDGSLPPGNYVAHVTGEGTHLIEKLTVVR